MRSSDSQLEFDFSGTGGASPESDAAFDRWRAEMKAEDEGEARRLGLPLRRRVEVQLECGALLRGRLLLAHPELLRLQRRPARLDLVIGDSLFDHTQIARCLVLDDAVPDDAAPTPMTAEGGASPPTAKSALLDARAASRHTPEPEPES